MRLDVFTQVPHAFGWLTEQKPLATVLGTELELRLFNYRDTTPLRAGQVDDTPYGGGAGMVLRVDVVAAALEAVYGSEPPARVIALTPQGRQLDQALVEELAAEPAIARALLPLRGLRRADRRPPLHRCGLDRAVRPLGGELPAMVLVDAIARRLPGALAAGSGENESFSDALDGGIEYPHYTRPAAFRGWDGAGRAALREPRARSTPGGASRAGSGASCERRRGPARGCRRSLRRASRRRSRVARRRRTAGPRRRRR